MVLFALGGLEVVFGLFAFGGAALLSGSGLGGAVLIVAVLATLLGGASIYAGWGVMALREQGRLIGLLVSGIGGVLVLVGVITGDVTPVVGLSALAFAFVIYVLLTRAGAFRR